jgi:hypothetical protein
MMTHEGRGLCLSSGPPPRSSNFGGGGGRIPHSFAPSLAYVFGVSVHGLLLVGHSFACNTADGA